MKRTDKRLRLCITLLLCNLVFIWGNSLLPGQVSGAFSDWVKSILVRLFSMDPNGSGGGGLLRKAAHFTEFAALGMCLAWLHGMLQKGRIRPFLWGVLAAAVDETIQRFVPERGPSIRDVCIDSAGVLTGIILLWLGHNYLKRDRLKTLEDKNMKKILSVVLALSLVLSLAACGGKKAEETTEPALSVEGTMEELLNKVIEERPVEFMGGVIPVDLTDSTEDGLWAIKSYTGLEDASSITEAAAFEPMMGSMAFSMVLVRLMPDAGSKTVAEDMKSGIDTRKWICVEADDLKVAGFGDVVMLVMLNSDSGMTAQSFVDAFAKVAGFEPEFVI